MARPVRSSGYTTPTGERLGTASDESVLVAGVGGCLDSEDRMLQPLDGLVEPPSR
jgi:hypothetical protein